MADDVTPVPGEDEGLWPAEESSRDTGELLEWLVFDDPPVAKLFEDFAKIAGPSPDEGFRARLREAILRQATTEADPGPYPLGKG